MKRSKELLAAWSSRANLSDQRKFSDGAREAVAVIFIEVADHHDIEKPFVPLTSHIGQWSGQLVSIADSDALPIPAFCTEVRNCQVSLFELLVSRYLDRAEDKALATILSRTLSSLEQLIEASTADLKAMRARRADSSGSKPKVKTLQHEIRTPLQGALLTTELMLEDSVQGDIVQADDIIAVRRSIESAVQILNDFAERPVNID